VTLAIRDGLLPVTAVGQGEADIGQVPVIVGQLLQDLDPHIGDGHGQTVVEANPTQGEGQAQGRHAGHIFSDRDGLGVELVQHLVGDHEVSHGLIVYARAEVLVVAAGESPVSSVSRMLVYVKEAYGEKREAVQRECAATNGHCGEDLRSNTVVGVEHARNPVEAEAIEFVLIHPESQVTQQEAHHLVTTVVEQATIP
jgi:hypothetical protein